MCLCVCVSERERESLQVYMCTQDVVVRKRGGKWNIVCVGMCQSVVMPIWLVFARERR